jgi:predicted ester cyclase
MSTIEKEAEALLVALALEEGFNRRDVGRIESVVGDHCLERSSWLGRTDLRQRLTFVLKVLPDARLRIGEQIVQGDTVAFHWTIEGPHRGEYMGIAPTGRTVALSGITVARVREGRVYELSEVVDEAGFHDQLSAAATVRAVEEPSRVAA